MIFENCEPLTSLFSRNETDDQDANRSNLPLNRNIAFLPYALSETIIRVMNMEFLLDSLTTIQPQPPNHRHHKVMHSSHNMYRSGYYSNTMYSKLSFAYARISV